MEFSFSSKYPFTSEAKQKVEGSSLELNDEIMERAVQRVVAALKGEKEHAYRLHPSDELIELGSYAAARVMLAYLKNRFLTGRFAVAEAKRASSFMRSDSEENIRKLGDELGIKPTEFEGRMVLPVSQYVSFSPRSVDYRLIFRNVAKGFVEVKRPEVIRLMEEAVRIRMEALKPVQSPPKIIQEYSKKLMVLVPKEAVMKMSFKEGDNPPCIEKLLEQARAHQNLNHQARWALAVYLLSKNVSMEKVHSIFSNLPDYDEKKTKYQLEHVVKRGYTMPACATLLSYGICVADCRIGSPLNWKGKVENWKKRKSSSS
ncbi:hypothetical protein H0O01_00770 [Candidatus Micrarchaeota archaeon]|nr:hypothetical protein [Candidatus Micrarchaeota archaeon]